MRFGWLLAAALAAVPARADEGTLPGAGGAPLHYRYRPGTGAPIVLVHGFAIGSEGFAAWEELFAAGRPLLVFDRRGYPPSGGAPADEEEALRAGAEDVARAVEYANARSPGTKAGVIALSLGARFLGALSSGSVRWIALLNPGAVPLVRHQAPMRAAQSWAFAATKAGSRFWLPVARRAWARAVAESLVDKLPRLAGMTGSAAAAIERAARERLAHQAFTSSLIEEAAAALFSPPAGFPDVPILLAVSSEDDVVPPGAFAELRRSLAGRKLREATLPGGHVAPLLAPEPWFALVAELDRAAP